MTKSTRKQPHDTKSKSNHPLLTFTTATTAAMLTYIGSYSLEISNVVRLLTAFAVFGVIYGVVEAMMRASNKENGSASTNRMVAIGTACVLMISYAALYKSLFIDPFAENGNRFALQNIGIAASVIGWLGLILLSTLQKDRYWPYGNPQGLDEREISDRRRIFEYSYKLSLAVSALTALLIAMSLDDAPKIIALNGGSLPGSIVWLALTHTASLVAIPLVIASYRNK